MKKRPYDFHTLIRVAVEILAILIAVFCVIYAVHVSLLYPPRERVKSTIEV